MYQVLAIIALVAASAGCVTHLIRMRVASPTSPRPPYAPTSIVTGLLWVSGAYLMLRFPLTCFIALGSSLGHALMMFLGYSLLIFPLWILFGLFLFDRIKCATASVLPLKRRSPQSATLVLLGLLLWGAIGELRMLIDPALESAVTRLPM